MTGVMNSNRFEISVRLTFFGLQDKSHYRWPNITQKHAAAQVKQKHSIVEFCL